MSYIERDIFGMYKKHNTGAASGSFELMGANTLLGEDIYNLEGENLGEIKEIVLNMKTGGVVYAVLSFGGFLGMGNKLFAVPWRALSLDPQTGRFILRASKDELKQAPGFEKDHWPDMADPKLSREIDAFYDVTGH